MLVCCAALFLWARPCRAQQDIGHRVLGTIGIDAGTQAPTGYYLVNDLAFYRSTRLVDRAGHAFPIGFDLHAGGYGIGLAGVWKLPVLNAYLTSALGVPITHVNLRTIIQPTQSFTGLGDLYLLPAKLGWRWERFDVVGGYAVYVPSRNLSPPPAGPATESQWTHELQLGGTVYFDPERTWRFSALSSVDFYARKPDIDITRGTTIQLQGGVAKKLMHIIDVGVASYALWQVTDNHGTQLPPALIDARDRDFGLGPEVDVLVPSIHAKFTARYEHDFGVRSRPVGQIFFLGATFVFSSKPSEEEPVPAGVEISI